MQQFQSSIRHSFEILYNIRVTLYIHFAVVHLCQRGSHVMRLSLIEISVRLLAAELHSAAGTELHNASIPNSVLLWNDLGNSEYEGVGLAGFKSRVNGCLLS